MNTPLSGILPAAQWRFGLLPRLLIVNGFLAVETLLISGLIQSPRLLALTGAALVTHEIQHWAFRFLIAYAGSVAILLYLRGAETGAAAGSNMADAPVSMRWLIAHGLLLITFALLSTALYRGGNIPFSLLAVGWHAFGFAAALALFLAAAPLQSWLKALRKTGALTAYALIPAAAALVVYKASQLLWGPAAALTFQLVRWIVRPFTPSLTIDSSTLTLITPNFSVQVSEVCSGLEGVGLMLVFCAAWLWYFRREYIFPRALLIVPVAVLVIFLLNALRIAALVFIGDAGHQRIAAVGFHSQAGWIAFNLAAFGVALVTKHSAWLNRRARHFESAAGQDATAAFLMPLLAILAAGMIARALSAGFDLFYPLRLACAAVVLFVYRGAYRSLDWGFSWRGVAAGLGVFVLWALIAHFLAAPAPIPGDLAGLSAPLRAAWIICRAAAAIITVPIAEELAYRGFLMRRLVKADFAAVMLQSVPWWAIAISAAAFGIMHGNLWFPGIVAGFVYGAVAVKTGKIGESVAAHATTNSLIAIQVLLFGQWQLW
ncbi:MAG TPA: exosortase E/protease, VPEID-CTERM system [Steroidobacteraceae bacterium]